VQAGERRQGIRPLLFAGPLAVVVAAVVAVLWVTHPPEAGAVVALLVGALAACGAVLLWLPGRGKGRRPVPSYQRWMAAAFAVAAVGQVLRAVTALRGPPENGLPFPNAGDLVALVVPALAITGLLLFAGAVPGLTGVGLPAARILLDAVLLGCSLALVVWRFGFQERSAAGPGVTVLAVVALLADLVVGCMAGLLALRRAARRLLVAALGVGAVVVGHILVLQQALDGGWSWPGRVLMCVGWPLMAGGLLSYRPSSRRLPQDPPVDYDARLSAVTATGTAVVLGVGVLAILLRPPVDRASLWLVLVLIVTVWIREMLTTGQRTGLVRRLQAEATLDPLTGLANRRNLTRRLGLVSGPQPWCLLTLDLDAFKTVNDVLGHGTGDLLLQAAAVRLREVVPARAVVARVGGDEFAVLLAAAVPEAQRLGDELIAAVRRACGDVPGVNRLGVSASVGLAEVPAPGSGADPLSALSAAGAAQQLAKAAGRDRVQVFDDEVARMRRRRLTVEERLRAAVGAGDIRVHYQPIVDLECGRLAGVEALARWVDDELGPVAPEEFIAVAEESGLVVPLGELVLNEALRQAVEAGLPAANLRVNCNVSPLQLRVPGFHRVVEGALAAHRMPPSSVVVEVTEAALVEEEGVAVRTLRRLDDLGVRIAIDDFGTGYSALGYLRRLPASILKIDKSLTGSLLEEPRARAITQTVTELGRKIGLSVVVEGVESREVADLVRSMGAQYGQGSLFGAACPLGEVPGLQQPTIAANGHARSSVGSARGPHGAAVPIADLSGADAPARRAARPPSPR
jgi:diguanylate cyclase (GGDEF)-like protein